MRSAVLWAMESMQKWSVDEGLLFATSMLPLTTTSAHSKINLMATKYKHREHNSNFARHSVSAMIQACCHSNTKTPRPRAQKRPLMAIGWARCSTKTMSPRPRAQKRPLVAISNKLSQLPSEAFSGLTSLQTLDLQKNKLSQLPSEVFSGSRPWSLWIWGGTTWANCRQRSFLGSRP